MRKDKFLILYYMLGVCLIFSLFFNLFLMIDDDKLSIQEIFNNSIYSVVELKARTQDYGESYGTAEFISNDGTLITNAHIVTYKKMGEIYLFDEISIRFASENDYRSVSLIKYDMDFDIAVLKLNDLNSKFIPFKLGNSNNLSNGDIVYAIGNLNNTGISITKGIVSNSKINVEYHGVTRNVIQCDLVIADGNSGGALIDSNGNLIGITTFRLKDTLGNVIYGISYCVPINIVLEYIENK